MRNDTHPRADDQVVSSKKSPKYTELQPPLINLTRVQKLVVERKLTALEVVMLQIIDSLTRNGEGCWMSNARFANTFNVSPRAIWKMFAKLRKLELIHESGTVELQSGRKMRVLETDSRKKDKAHKGDVS